MPAASRSRPTNELAGLGRFVFESVFSGGKPRVTELVDRDRLGDVLEAVLAELDEIVARELASCTREDDLPSMCRSGNAGSRWTSPPT